MTDDTLLLRQIPNSWVQSGRVTRQAFRPTPKDKRELSVYDGDLVNAKDAWQHHTKKLGYSSVGIRAVTRGECGNLGLDICSSPTKHIRCHVSIVFPEKLSRTDVDAVAKRLADIANARGWMFRIEGI